jgi:hypothetical protein
MKIFRGPYEKNFLDDTHKLVAIVSSEKLEESITSGSRFEFNITKDGWQRKAICNAFFEDDDIVPIVNGVMSKLKIQQEKLKEISKILKNIEINNDDKIALIKNIL